MSKANRGTTTEREALRRACFRTWGKTCMYCGEIATEVDHILELDAGGSNTLDNLQPLCKPCHQAKTAAYNRSRGRQKPTEPRRAVFSGRVAPTDSLSLIPPRLVRFEPPMKKAKGN